MVETEKEDTSSELLLEPPLEPPLELEPELEELEPQPKEGEDEVSWPQEPEMTFCERGAKRLPGSRLPYPSLQVKPWKLKPP